MCRMLDRVTDTFLQPSQRKCSCSSRLLGMAFQLRRCLAFLQPFFFLHSGLWHCRHVLQCIHKSIKNNRKCYQRYITINRCVGIALDLFLLFFLLNNYILSVSIFCNLYEYIYIYIYIQDAKATPPPYLDRASSE